MSETVSEITATITPSYRRRDLLRAGAVGAFAIVAPRLVRATEANSAVRVGLLGCGRRGSADATSIAQHTTARVVALADLFPDALEKAKLRFDALAQSKGYAGVARTFAGPDAYRQMAESADVDAIVIATPAYYHPEHLAAVVAAGKHVYCEKPVAVDVNGTRRVLEIGAKAEGKVSLDVGFQIRSAPPFVELVRRIHAGALGEIHAGSAHYFCGLPDYPAWPGASPAQARLRNWLSDRVLSGDIIVEQNIHAIDICNWVLGTHPVSAIGRGGPEGRNGAGDVYSHFDVVFTYPNAADISFSSVQFGKGKFDVDERFFGTRGSSQSPYSGRLGTEGEEPWAWEGSDKPASGEFSAAGTFEDNLAHADEEKHKAFIESIVSGKLHNQAATGVESALTAMLGREAAYRKHEITWQELTRLKQHWDAGIDLRKL